MLELCLGRSISIDATFKVMAKTSVVERDRSRIKPLRGGLVQVLNEHSEILTWVRRDVRSAESESE